MRVKEIDEIKHAVLKVAGEFPLKKVKLFGSYADNKANDDSDIDLLVEFNSNDVTLLTLTGLKYRLEDLLGISVDIIEMPVPEDSILQIERTMDLYEQ
jgi:predicted nucleotidyltransferase